MKTAIILPCYIPDDEVFAHYKSFIDSLRRTTPQESYQLIIVDNGTPSAEAVKRMETDADIYFRSPLPLGYARAVNLGIEIAYGLADFFDLVGGKFVVANNDIVLDEPWLEKMILLYDEIKPGLLSVQDNPQKTERFYPNESWYSFWMIDAQTWKEVGALDDTKLNYRFHDQDYSIRLAKKGYFVGRTGLIQAKHANSATYKKMNRNEDPDEKAEMIARHGHALFSDWVRAKK